MSLDTGMGSPRPPWGHRFTRRTQISKHTVKLRLRLITEKGYKAKQSKGQGAESRGTRRMLPRAPWQGRHEDTYEAPGVSDCSSVSQRSPRRPVTAVFSVEWVLKSQTPRKKAGTLYKSGYSTNCWGPITTLLTQNFIGRKELYSSRDFS